MWVPADKAASRDLAVIDVGSNSVRLVLYRVEGRAIWTVFNEKVLAGLGRDLTETGRLSPAGAQAALSALRRFRAVLDGVRPADIYTAATAAVREAKDGPAFVERVRRDTGLKLRVLTGEQEARLSALGVSAGQPRAEGVVGDLGGFSLELIRLSKGKPKAGATLPLGPFALGAPDHFDPHAIRAAVERELARVDKSYAGANFYAVGGAWRNIALLHMSLSDYPLRIVHQYELGAREALETAQLVARQSRSSLERIVGVSKKRSETLPYAALVLEGLIERLGFSRVVISAYGLREGLILDAMPETVRALDPLVEGCAALGARQGAAEQLGPALEAWLAPFWRKLEPAFETGREAVLLAAACRLADLGARLHPDHRAQMVFDQVLRAPVAGVNHQERAFLAAALHSRHTGQPPPEPETLGRLLSPELAQRARTLGLAMRLGCDLSGRSPPLLGAAALTLEKGFAVLTAEGRNANLLLGEQTTRRLAALAQALDLEPKIKTS
ncbi:MAG TPA: Ppx/GppA phosphatase family protein [Caulobacteraceae bacterium]|jgi:exopolyphosphatase/guanosine-5'-triphosphate,3'-diphosphate pyrophosphatase|nr:Ppx/GppA phosphatase family protein [Caulobacteraceae bacterium]